MLEPLLSLAFESCIPSIASGRATATKIDILTTSMTSTSVFAVTFLVALEFSGLGEKGKALGRMIPWRVLRAIWNYVTRFPSALFIEVWTDGDVAKVNGTAMGQYMDEGPRQAP